MAAKKGRSVTKEEGRNMKQKPRLVPNCTRDLRAMFALPFLSLCGERRNPPLACLLLLQRIASSRTSDQQQPIPWRGWFVA